MNLVTDLIYGFSSLSMEQVNGLVAVLALIVAGLGIYLAVVAIKGARRSARRCRGTRESCLSGPSCPMSGLRGTVLRSFGGWQEGVPTILRRS